MDQIVAADTTALKNFILNGTRTEVTKTYYDTPLLTTLNQKRLRNRIAAVTYEDIYFSNPLKYLTATHYSYDIHGNVKRLIQNIKALAPCHRDTIFIDYEYDLVSGNVNKVWYQKDKAEQFIHRYRYDADNRLTHVYTSDDNMIWLADARYFYLPHGPLTRTEIGEKQVQGFDYAYTLQGWLKTMNSYILGDTLDMGSDGLPDTANACFALDAAGYNLQYYTGDYRPILGNNNFAVGQSQAVGLYNGNIAAMSSDLFHIIDPPIAKAFRYDYLNRIRSMQTATANGTQWNNLTNNYYCEYHYDFNGNIVSLKRYNQSAVSMHSINYTYSSGKNRLASIATAGDIVSSTYQYDAIGNLKRDVAENVIIQWNLAGKVKQVNTPDYMLQYSYSPLGQRQIKLVEPINIDKGFQYYLHDATGNIMCIYDLPNNDTLSVIERVVYGSSRIGINRKVIAIKSGNWDTLPDTNRFRGYCGYRNFELSNHLGNVLTTFSDRKQGMDDNSDGIVDYYRPVVTSWTDYYPFGYPMPSRNWNGADYRFGFNGQEKDNEIYGEGKSYTAEFWQYDSRLGRRWNLDPLGKPWESSYATFADSPVRFSDILGLDTIYKNYKGKEIGRKPGGDDFSIVFLPPAKVIDKYPEKNPYSKGSIPYWAFEKNRYNPNLWNNKSSFSWTAGGKSPWMRDFDRAFGWMLPVTLLTPFVAEGAVAVGASAVETAPIVAANTKNIARFIYSNINYYGRYTVLKANGLYLGITSSDIYFMTLGYSSTVMAVPAVQFTGGLIVGYYGGDIFTPDFNTGNQAFDMGLQMGSLIYFYKKEFHINYYKKDSNEKKSSN